MSPAKPKPKSSSATRRAQFIVSSFSVICPHCGGSQPNQDGSEMWTPEDLESVTSGNYARRCVDCEELIAIDRVPKSARFDYGG